MSALQALRGVLRTVAQQVEVLPAVGGAQEDLERPDAEEREDQRLNYQERVFESIFERDESGRYPALYRPTPPVGRRAMHLYRYFLDGSFRSYFLGTVLEHDRESPVHFAQVGACALRREPDGSVRREQLQILNILLAGKERLSEDLWASLESLAHGAGIHLLNIAEREIDERVASDMDLRSRAAGKVRFETRKLEAALIEQILPALNEDTWLITDGSLMFQPILNLLTKEEQIYPVIGVSKNFRKDPQFVYGRGPRAERFSIYRLLKELQAAHRTAVFSAREGKVVFWYVRLREQRQMDYPLMGVVKVELANPTQEPVPSALIDRLSSALVAERRVTPHGRDRRWHAHLYPIHLAERAVREALLSREAVQQFLKWR